MKRLLNTLFVLTEDVYLKLDGENVVVVREAETLARYPLHTLEAILCFSYKGASPALMGACAQRGMQLSFLAPSGRFLACAYGEERGNVLLRKEQYRISDAPLARLPYCAQYGDGQSLQRPMGACPRCPRPSPAGGRRKNQTDRRDAFSTSSADSGLRGA